MTRARHLGYERVVVSEQPGLDSVLTAIGIAAGRLAAASADDDAGLKKFLDDWKGAKSKVGGGSAAVLA